MQSPFLSIITVVYNGARTFENSIKSITGQSFQGIEYIVVDGGSTDGTVDIIKRYSDKISYWVSEPDKGIYDAMNKGIKVAKGQWIYFLGADDSLYDNTTLEKVANELQKCDCDFFYGNVLTETQQKPYDGVFDMEKLLKRNISHQAIFFHHRLFEKLGLYNTRYTIYADWDFNIRCFRVNDIKIVHIDMLIAYFARGGFSSSYDVLFLRESIIPLRIERLELEPGKLRKVKAYDEWWRLLRNAKIRSLKELYEIAGNRKIHTSIKSMILWQQKIPVGILRVGIISKFYMGLNYFFNVRQTKI